MRAASKLLCSGHSCGAAVSLLPFLSLCAPSLSSRRVACAPAAPQQVCARICCARALAVIPLYSLYTTFPLFISNFDFDIASSASIVAARSCIFDYPASSHSSRCAAHAHSSQLSNMCVCAHLLRTRACQPHFVSSLLTATHFPLPPHALPLTLTPTLAPLPPTPPRPTAVKLAPLLGTHAP